MCAFEDMQGVIDSVYTCSICLKLMIVGDGGVGKSCFITRFVVSNIKIHVYMYCTYKCMCVHVLATTRVE